MTKDSWSVNYSSEYPLITLIDVNGVVQKIDIKEFVDKVISEANKDYVEIVKYFVSKESNK